MPRSKRPSFLTKLKEQQRRTKATEKREARRARQKAKTTKSEPDLAVDDSNSETPVE